MGDYESGYDPKYGYNRNAFAHETIGTAIMGRIVKMIATPIGLVSEAIHNQRDKRIRSEPHSDPTSAEETSRAEKIGTGGREAASTAKENADNEPPVYVEVPNEEADELIKTHQAVPTDGKAATHELIPVDSKDDGMERDEADWALDEAASETESKLDSQANSSLDESASEPNDVVQSILPPYSRADPRPQRAASNSLPFPVVIPQRRPGTKARGFVRAYTPALQDAGVNQEMFLGFLKDFHKAAQASPIFDVIMIATAIAGAYPDILVGLAVQAVQIAAAVGQEVQERWRTNKFLDQANKEFFMPRGLFALLVTYKPGDGQQADVGTSTIDLGASALAKYGENLMRPAAEMTEAGEVEQAKDNKLDGMKGKMKNLRIASGETHGEAEFPITCAPLIFPALDAVAAATEEYKSENQGVASSILAKSKSSSKFVGHYFDRRAQAIYVSLTLSSYLLRRHCSDHLLKAVQNPNSTLTTQMGAAAPQFKSRFADPNNHTNMHFFTLISGGRYKAEP